MGVLGRLVAFAVLVVTGWFVWFVVAQPEPAPATVRTDAIVVLTGGPRRVARGIELMQAEAAERMLISGVDPKVRPIELAVEYKVPPQLFECCVDLGREAVDTRSNAEETAAWVRRHRYKTVRLVTSADHMHRAQLELAARLGGGVEVIADPVQVERPPSLMLREFSKYALRRAALVIGI